MKNRNFLTLCLCASVALTSCAAITPANANRDLTIGIASAGAAANAAEQEYQSGQIPQTPANRNAINTLGNAYNDARAAFLVVLTAESVYRGTQNMQIAACAPGVINLQINGAPATCATATANATKAQAQLAADNAALTAKVAAMGTQTTQVNALAKKQ